MVKSRLSWIWIFFTLIFCLLPTTGRADTHTVTCKGKAYRYELYAPQAVTPLPAILLLHGAGDSPDAMMRAWFDLAKKEGIAIIAPELPRSVEFEEIAPRVFRCVVEDAKASVSLDTKRLYVFGNSMGGYLAYDAAAFDSDYFAAVGVHAMGISPEYDSILDKAVRKTPIAIYTGDRDPLVPLTNVRRTRDLLLKKGFPVQYMEIAGHAHNYYEVREKVNKDVWNFFRSHTLQQSGANK